MKSSAIKNYESSKQESNSQISKQESKTSQLVNESNKIVHDSAFVDFDRRAVASFALSSGALFHENKRIKYVIRELIGTCFSIDLTVETTSQQWTVFVPSCEPVTQLLNSWRNKSAHEKTDYSILDKLCTWLLSCITLKFKDENIQAARFDHALFEQCYTKVTCYEYNYH